MAKLGDNISDAMTDKPRIQRAKPAVAPDLPDLPAEVRVATVKRVAIMLEENDNIPPTGLFIGCNGNSYMLRPGIRVNALPELLEVLDNAVMSTAIMDPSTQRVVGYRDKLRYPYRILTAA